jgi:CHAT domain-containing protein
MTRLSEMFALRRARAIPTVVGLGVCVALSAFAAESARDNIAKLADAGQEELAHHNPAGARSDYLSALALAESANDYIAAAALHSLVGELNEAASEYQKALGRYETALRILDTRDAGHDAKSLLESTTLRLGSKSYQPSYGPPVSTDLYRGEIPHLVQLLSSSTAVETLRAILLTNAGNMYLNQNQFKPAEDLYQRAVNLVHGNDPLFERKILVNLAWSSIKRGDPNADQRLAKVMLNVPSSPPPVEFRKAILAVGVRLREKKQYADAIKRIQQAVALYKAAHDETGYTRALAHLGTAYLEAGELRSAERSYTATLDANQVVKDSETEWHAQAGLAKCYDLLGNAPEALRHYRSYLDAISWIASDFTTDQGQISFFEQHEEVFEEFARLALRADRAPGFSGEARDAIEHVRAKGFEQLLTSRTGSAPVQPGRLTVNFVLRGEDESGFMAQQAASGVYAANAAARGVRLLDTEDVAHSTSLHDTAPPPTTFLEYYVTTDRTAIFVKTAKNEVFSAIAAIGNGPLDELVAEYRRALDVDGLRGGLAGKPTARETNAKAVPKKKTRTLSELEEDLYRLLIAPVSQWLPVDSKEPIVIVPHRALWILPFATLRETNQDYFGDQHVLTYAASEDTWKIAAGHSRAADQRTVRAWIAGNPDMPESGKKCNGEFSFQPLPGAQQEAETVAKLFRPEQVTLFTGAQADRFRLDAWHSEFTVLHLATHGLACLSDPLDSFVVLSSLRPDALVLDKLERRVSLNVDPRLPVTFDIKDDHEWDQLAQSEKLHNYPGILDGRDIVNHFRLRADLVTLSACQTGLGKVLGQGSIGLTRAFMAAGARSVLASLWRVDDDATRDLMVAFYKEYLRHGNKGLALQNAMKQTRQQYPEPRYWAAFSLFGMAQ